MEIRIDWSELSEKQLKAIFDYCRQNPQKIVPARKKQ